MPRAIVHPYGRVSCGSRQPGAAGRGPIHEAAVKQTRIVPVGRTNGTTGSWGCQRLCSCRSFWFESTLLTFHVGAVPALLSPGAN